MQVQDIGILEGAKTELRLTLPQSQQTPKEKTVETEGVEERLEEHSEKKLGMERRFNEKLTSPRWNIISLVSVFRN